jgi:N utilization substance protein A
MTGWDVDILTPDEFSKGLAILEETVRPVAGVTDEMLDKMGALGLISVFDVEEVGPEMLENELQATAEVADAIVAACSEKAKVVAEQQEKDRAEAEARAAEEASAADALLGGGEPVQVDESAEAAAEDILGGTPGQA